MSINNLTSTISTTTADILCILQMFSALTKWRPVGEGCLRWVSLRCWPGLVFPRLSLAWFTCLWRQYNPKQDTSHLVRGQQGSGKKSDIRWHASAVPWTNTPHTKLAFSCSHPSSPSVWDAAVPRSVLKTGLPAHLGDYFHCQMSRLRLIIILQRCVWIYPE